jgi:hypothetical protein
VGEYLISLIPLIQAREILNQQMNRFGVCQVLCYMLIKEFCSLKNILWVTGFEPQVPGRRCSKGERVSNAAVLDS